MSIYNNLHSSIHSKNTHVKVHHCVSRSVSSFAWVTPVFELYCVAEPNANRSVLAQSASRIAQWVQKEEERLFIIGGAVRYTLYEPMMPKLTFPAGLLMTRRQRQPVHILLHIPTFRLDTVLHFALHLKLFSVLLGP